MKEPKSALSLLALLLLLAAACSAFSVPPTTTRSGFISSTVVIGLRNDGPLTTTTALLAKDNAEEEEEEDDEDEIDIEKTLEEKMEKIDQIGNKLMNLASNVPESSGAGGQPKLGIDLGAQLKPFSDKEAADLKAAAMEIINDGFAEGIDEIDALRKQMRQQIDKQRAQNNLVADLQLQKEQSRLLKKIDKMTSDFLTSTQATRDETKLVAKADKLSQQQGQGVEYGVWGMIGGAAVATTGSKHVGLLGSIDAAKLAAARAQKDKQTEELADVQRSFGTAGMSLQKGEEEATMGMVVNNNRVVIIADPSQDPMAKKLIPAFTEAIRKDIPTIKEITVVKPTETIPLGGDNAACAILFCTSLSDRSSVNKIMDRLLRKTMQSNGQIGSPPTQLVAISTIGTERTDKMPYSMQNLLGGKLEQRRQMEEAVMATVQDRVVDPPLDFTILKFGELKDAKDPLSVMPGDVLDGTTPLDTATNVLLQAVAYQPYARNATLCAVGNIPATTDEDERDAMWDDAFLRLDGPEVERWTMAELGHSNVYDRLCEYLNEWANNFALNPRGLTTPIRVEPSKIKPSSLTERVGVRERSGVQLLFLPTATGKNYLSKEEERKREMVGMATKIPRNKMAKEGGIEVVVEITDEDQLRIRAKRVNYAVGVPLKELSEETILKRLEKAIDVWCKESN